MIYEIKGLNFSYDKKKILHDINFSINKGDFLALIGPNGSGKTTLLKTLTGYLKPQLGNVRFQGKDIEKYNKQELARKIAVVPQDVQTRFPFSCLEVVLMGRNPYKNRMQSYSEEDYEIVYKCMEETDTLKFVDHPITEVSVGERQRVILARAFAQTPKVIFLDEAFSAMDVHYCIQALNLLKKKVDKEGLAVISIMHDLNMADTYSDTVVALKEGKLVQWGSVEQVMEPSFIHSLFKINVKKVGNRGLAVLPNL